MERTDAFPYASIEVDARAPRDGAVAIEARLVWAGEVIAVAHARPRPALRVRDLGLPAAGAHDLVVARDGALVLPNGAPVPSGHRVTIRVGRAALKLSLVADDVARGPRFARDRRAPLGIAAAAALHLAVLGAVVHRGAPAGAPDAPAAAFATPMATIAAAEARASDETPDEAPEPSPPQDPASIEAAPAAARRVEPRREAASFGMLAIVAGGARRAESPWVGATLPDATGSMWRESIGDVGGLALGSAGVGGGGPGAGVPLR